MKHWNISVRRPLPSDTCDPSHKGAPIASEEGSYLSHPVTFSSPHGFDVSPTFTIPDRPVDKGGAGHPLNEGFADLFLNSKDLAQREHVTLTSRVPVKMERSTST